MFDIGNKSSKHFNIKHLPILRAHDLYRWSSLVSAQLKGDGQGMGTPGGITTLGNGHSWELRDGRVPPGNKSVTPRGGPYNGFESYFGRTWWGYL